MFYYYISNLLFKVVSNLFANNLYTRLDIENYKHFIFFLLSTFLLRMKGF